MPEVKKYPFGLEKNVASSLCYVLGWISGLVFFLAEKEDKDIRFHAMQAIIFFGGLTLVMVAIGWIPFIGWGLTPLLSLLGLVAWIVCMVKTYQGEKFKLPVVGDIAEKRVSK